MPLVREDDVQELELPGRAPGETVRPAHAHPNGEEVIYIIRGCGRVMIDGAVDAVKEGTAVLFPQGSVHMLQNTGSGES